MTRRLFIFAFIFFAGFAFGFDFPASSGKILSFFAQDSDGNFNTGYEIKGKDVCASEDGEVVFYGNRMIAIQHSGGIMTIYSNVDALDAAVDKNFVKKGEVIASAVGGSFHFDILDTEMNRYINPSLMLNRIKKVKLPKVLEVACGGAGVLEVKLDKMNADTLYSLQIFVNGIQLCDLRFETISASDGVLRLDGTGFECRALYRKSGVFSFLQVPFKSGDNSVEVIVKDFYGKSVSFRGDVKA